MNMTENLFLEAIYCHAKRQVLADETYSLEQRETMLAALKQVEQRAVSYAADFYLPCLVLGFAREKSRMVVEAESLSEIREILKPSVPALGSNGKFHPGKYGVPEEELILLSKASLEAPFTSAAYRRYEEVFTELFPEEAEQIFGKKQGKRTA